jgi:hypothetical protein
MRGASWAMRVVAAASTSYLLAAAACQAQPQSLVEVARAWCGDEQGRPQVSFYRCEPGVYFYVALRGNVAQARSEHALHVYVQHLGGGELVHLGGPFGLERGDDPSGLDLPRSCSANATNGLALGPAAPPAGRYRAHIYLDGIEAKPVDFSLIDLANTGTIYGVEAHLEDAEGRRRTRFSAKDPGVFVRLGVVNQTPESKHQHLVRVTFTSPRGVVGPTLGGTFEVAAGQVLDGLDLPAAADPQQRSGLKLQGTPQAHDVGTWLARVWLDGQLWACLPFEVGTQPADTVPQASL